MTPRCINPPAAEPVTLQGFIDHLRGLGEADPAGDVALKLTAAREYIEAETGRAMVTAGWEVRLRSWPCGNYIELPLGNLQSVGDITYTDQAAVERTFDASNYLVVGTYIPPDPAHDPPIVGHGTSDCGFGRIYLRANKSWPSESLEAGEPIVIPFVCGWGADYVPAALKAAILMAAADLYRNREATVTGNSNSVSVEVALGVQQLISKYVDRRF